MKEPVRRRMRGPLAPYVPEFRTHLASLGFGPVAVKTRLSQFGEISRWLEAEGLGPSELTEEHAARFITARRAKGRVTWVTDACMAVPLNYLRSIGIAPTQTAPVADSPLDALLADSDFDSFRWGKEGGQGGQGHGNGCQIVHRWRARGERDARMGLGLT